MTDNRISDAELIQALQNLHHKLGERPTFRDMEREGEYCSKTYTRRFGSWTQAIERAGLPSISEVGVDQPNRYSKSELVEEFQMVKQKIGKAPTTAEFRQHSNVTIETIQRHFGGMGQARAEAGMDPEPYQRREYTDEELLDELRRVYEVTGNVPGKRAVKKHCKHSTTTYRERFGTFTEALEAAGFDAPDPHRNTPSGEEHWNWKGGKYENQGRYYGSNWNSRRHDVLKRDGYACLVCGKTEEKSRSEHGCSLHIHHITPISEFDAPEEANKLSNLTTLCPECHARWERLPIFPETSRRDVGET